MVKAVDENYFPKQEPEPCTEVFATNDIRYIEIFSYYNYYYGSEKKFILEYMNGRFNKDEINIIDSTVNWKFQPVHSAVARMIKRGWALPDRFVDNLNKRIKQIIDEYQPPQLEQAKAPINVQAHARQKQSMLIGTFDLEIDDFLKGYTTKFSPYEYLHKMQVNPAHATTLAEHYEKLLKEIDEVDSDADLKYAYRNMSNKQRKNYKAFVELIINDANRWANNKKTITRAPRKVKAVTPEKLVKYLKYKQEERDVKLVSVNPVNIIGAKQLWTYNHKYKSLAVYHALDGGLTIEGSTIKNFNPQDTIGKTLRKPEATLNTLVNAGAVTLRTVMSNITTKPWKPNGRINKDTVLVKVVR